MKKANSYTFCKSQTLPNESCREQFLCHDCSEVLSNSDDFRCPECAYYYELECYGATRPPLGVVKSTPGHRSECEKIKSPNRYKLCNSQTLPSAHCHGLLRCRDCSRVLSYSTESNRCPECTYFHKLECYGAFKPPLGFVKSTPGHRRSVEK